MRLYYLNGTEKYGERINFKCPGSRIVHRNIDRVRMSSSKCNIKRSEGWISSGPISHEETNLQMEREALGVQVENGRRGRVDCLLNKSDYKRLKSAWEFLFPMHISFIFCTFRSVAHHKRNSGMALHLWGGGAYAWICKACVYIFCSVEIENFLSKGKKKKRHL